MKILTPTSAIMLSALSLMLIQSSINAEGLYKWIDARGNTQYGDRPPPKANAKQIKLPKITIIEKYAEQWKPLDLGKVVPPKEEPTTGSNTYTKLSFVAPKPNQAVRANNGDVSAVVSIDPPLKQGHQLIFSVDGNSKPKSSSRTQNFANLNRGDHTISVKVIDTKGRTLKSSSVAFNVLRVNPLQDDQASQSTRAPQATKAPQATSFNNARQQQIQNSN